MKPYEVTDEHLLTLARAVLQDIEIRDTGYEVGGLWFGHPLRFDAINGLAIVDVEIPDQTDTFPREDRDEWICDAWVKLRGALPAFIINRCMIVRRELS